MKTPDQSLWPAITWQLGAIVESNDIGVAYRERTITGIIDTSHYPDLGNTPAIRATLRVPQAAIDAGAKVPVLISFGGSAWTYVAGHGCGSISFDQSALQGADTSSWIIGLINHGGWRKPDD